MYANTVTLFINLDTRPGFHPILNSNKLIYVQMQMTAPDIVAKHYSVYFSYIVQVSLYFDLIFGKLIGNVG